MTAGTDLRPAVGWLARRGRELLEAAGAGVRRPADVPPRRLRARAGAPGVSEFQRGGAAAADELAAALITGDFAAHTAILDFGCGSARVLPHVAARAAGTLCAGVDVDAEAIGWAAAAHPDLRLAVCQALPPLEWPDASFDLIYSISVFSHLTEPDQDAWLAELARVLAPGGMALLSTHGPSAFERFRTGAVATSWCEPGAFSRGPLGPEEMVSVPYRRSRWSRGDLQGTGEGYGLSFHSEGYLRSHWGRWLAIDGVREAAITGWQDLVVCRSRPDASDRGSTPTRSRDRAGRVPAPHTRG